MKHAFVVSGIALLVSLSALAQEPRHLFHASAFAVQGSADGRQIASDAAVVLPESGGSLSKRVENYDDGVGTLYLGHVTATPGERRIAMIRLDLGHRGMVVVGLDDVNGDSMP